MLWKLLTGLLQLLFLALPIAVIWGIVWLVRRMKKWQRERYDRMAAALQGEVVRDAKGEPLYVRAGAEGAELRVWYYREPKHLHDDHDTPKTFLIMEYVIKLGFTLFLCKDNVIFGMAEKLGAVADVEIGDPEFDKKYLIRSEEPARVVAFFENPNRRAAVNHLFLKGFREFTVTNESVRIKKMEDMRDLKPEILQDYAAQLKTLVVG